MIVENKTLEKALDELAEFRACKDMLCIEKQELIDLVYTPEIKARIDDINANFSSKSQTIDENISNLEELIKVKVLDYGTTIKGKSLMAVWVKGRETWDGQKLKGMMVLIPQLSQALKIGEPSVTIRKI
jgi:hypothetical protein